MNRKVMSLLLFLGVAAGSLSAQQPAQPTPEQMVSQLRYQWQALLLATTINAGAHGQTPADFGTAIGRLFAASWGTNVTPQRLVRGMNQNARLVGLQSEILEDTPEQAVMRFSRPDSAAFHENFGEMGATLADWDEVMNAIVKQIASEHGLVWEQHRAGNQIVAKATRKSSGGAAAGNQSPVFRAADRRTLSELMDEMARNVSRRDARALARDVPRDSSIIYISDGSVIRGRDFEAVLKSFYAGLDSLEFVWTRKDISFPAPQSAVAVGWADIRLRDKAQWLSEPAIFTSVYRQEDSGKWRLVTSHKTSIADGSTEAANVALVKRLLAEMDKHSTAIWDELATPDYVYHLPNNSPPMSREQHKATNQAFYQAFPDLQHEIMDIFAAGDRVVARLVNHGTHRGPFMGIAPTGKRIDMGAVSILRIVNGKIVEEWLEGDIYGLMQQLGAPAKAGGPEPQVPNP